MAGRVTPRIRGLLNERKLTRIKPDRKLVLREVKVCRRLMGVGIER
jgi:hypothetical protein